jgi:hypothetical protein
MAVPGGRPCGRTRVPRVLKWISHQSPRSTESEWSGVSLC